MPKIQVSINKYLNKYFDTTGIIEIDIDEDAVVKDLLVALAECCNAPILNTVTNEVELRRYCIVTVGNKLAKLSDCVIEPGKKVKLIPPISGG